MQIEMTRISSERRTRLDHLLYEVAWGLLFMLTGILWLVPSDNLPEGAWLFGVAAIFLGINIVRYFAHIPLNGFFLILGLISLIAGLGVMWGLDVPLLAACLITIGVSLVVKPFFARSA